MKNNLLIIFLFLCFSLSAQVFKVDKKEFLLTVSTALAADLSNNYVDRKLIDKPSVAELSKLDKDDVIFFDRIAFQPYSKKLKDWSDYAAYFTLGATAWIAFDEQYWLDNLMVFSEVMIVQSALTKWTKTLIQRYRPFAYQDDVSIEKKQERNSQHSFYSMHSSTTFAAATFGYYYYSQMYGRNLPAALLLYLPATATAVLRVASANHFPSDVVFGAIAGISVSYFICKLHRSDKIFVNFGLNSFNLEYRF
ncbi:MAG: phosphatase PAP2 family protein [Candidatus Cloacimonadales bacterium]|nr:phosphatase PAP2 family protein [Candidatus Cloacimonadales bacterium]